MTRESHGVTRLNPTRGIAFIAANGCTVSASHLSEWHSLFFFSYSLPPLSLSLSFFVSPSLFLSS